MTGVKRLNRRRLDGARVGAGIEACPRARRVRGKIYGRIRGASANGTIFNATGQQLYFQRGGYVVNPSGTTLALGSESLPAATTTLSGAVVRGATSLPIVAASIAPGFYWLGSRTIDNGSGVTRQAGGELVQVTASSANSATLLRSLIRPHASGASLQPVTVSRDVRVSGMRAYGVRGTTDNHIYVGTALGLTVDECQLIGSRFQSIYCIRSSDVAIRNIQVVDTPVGVPGEGYAVGPAQSVRMNISNIAASNSRHSVSLTGSCAEVFVNQISASSDCSFVFDDHDGSDFVTVRGASAPQLAASSTGQGVGIQLGNATWTWEGSNYTLEDCVADWIELRHRRINHTFERCDVRFITAVPGSHTVNGFTQRFQQITYRNGQLRGRGDDSTILLGTSAGTGLIEIDRVLFQNNVIATGATNRHTVTVRATQGTWTTYSLRIEGGTISGNRPVADGVYIVRQAGTDIPTANFRLEVSGTTIMTAEGTGGTTTPIFGRPTAMGGTFTMTAALATSATFRGGALASGNVSGATYVLL